MNQHSTSIDCLFDIDNYNFDAGQLTGHSGALLFNEFLRKTKLLSGLNKIPFDDSRSNPLYSNQQILFILTFLRLLGFAKQSDLDFLQSDPLLFSREKAPSQPTISRFYDRVSTSTIASFVDFISSMAADYINKNVYTIMLDADSTNIQGYGHQEGISYIHHYGLSGYHPIMINEFNTKLNLLSFNRPGNTYSSNGIVPALQQIFSKLKNLEEKTVQFRGDSAFYSSKLMDYLEEKDVIYYIRVKSFGKFTKTCAEHLQMNHIDLSEYSPENPYYGEMEYTITNTNISRRVVFKAYNVEDKIGQREIFPTFYAVITNDEYSSPEQVMETYEKRGASENFTKELKDDFKAGTLSMKKFHENEMSFLISVLSYNIFHIFQAMVMGKREQNMRMNTFRYFYQKIAGKIIHHARKITLSMSSSVEDKYEELFIKMMKTIELIL